MAIPETLATNSALGGTLYGFPEHFLVVLVWVVFESVLFNDALNCRILRLDTPEKFWAFILHRRNAPFTKVLLELIFFNAENILTVAK